MRIVPGSGCYAEGKKSHSSFSLQCAPDTVQEPSQNLPQDNFLHPGGVLRWEGRNRWMSGTEQPGPLEMLPQGLLLGTVVRKDTKLCLSYC